MIRIDHEIRFDIQEMIIFVSAVHYHQWKLIYLEDLWFFCEEWNSMKIIPISELARILEGTLISLLPTLRNFN